MAIRAPEAPATHRELLDLTRQVLAILDDQVKRNPDALDEKIAEYVFFPLYHIFRQMDSFPIILVENGVRCLGILITYGWKDKMPQKMVQQLLTLLTFIIDGVPGSHTKREVPEETSLESLRALTALFRIAGSSVTVAAGLADPDAVPALGHGVTVLLDSVVKVSSDAIQQEALSSIQAVYSPLMDQAALANFLPGTISSLAKALSTPKHYKRAFVARCLETVGVVLTCVLGDIRTRSIHVRAQGDGAEQEDSTKLLSPAWLKATSSQVRLALSSMMKLRSSNEDEIRAALRSLCVKLLDECHTTLADCTPFLVETAMVLDEGRKATSITDTNLRHLATIYPELVENAKSAVYNWLSALPRVVQSSDRDTSRNALYNISKGLELMKDLNIESATLEDTVSNALRDSTIALMTSGKSQAVVSSTDVVSVQSHQSMELVSSEIRYPPVLLDHESQKEVRSELVNLIGVIGSHSNASRLAVNLLEHVRTGGMNNNIAAMWLCFELSKAAQASSADETAFLDLSAFADSDSDVELVLQDLYSLSVEILDSHIEGGEADWRLEALALEITSHAAKRAGESFQPELIDVLFPVVTFLGSTHHNLRQHAIIALNEIASACGYESVSALIVDNVDYMVNSVSLHLNTLDISPASTQVLTMMIRLAGPRLVPFLDDVVDSVFGALENYHGYPAFVESLFMVLKELVDQAVGSDLLLLEAQKINGVPNHKKVRPEPEGIEGLLGFLDRRKTRQKYESEESKTKKAAQGHPTRPWNDDEKTGNDAEQDSAPPPEPEKPPNTVTYQLLLRIARLTQHHLTSPTPRLRRSLLELLSTASPALAGDEEAFLPLVNDVWPVVISRLYDPETFIAVEACRTLAQMCITAGDFLASRFRTEWGNGLGDWCRKVKRRVLAGGPQTRTTQEPTRALSGGDAGRKIMIPTAAGGVVEPSTSTPAWSIQATGSGGLGQHSSPVRLWEAVVRLLTSLVTHVRLPDDMFEDILDILAEVLERSAEVREALETVNPDAVWLVRYERGYAERLPTPQMEGVVFIPV